MIDRAIKFRCRVADRGTHEAGPSAVGRRSSPEPAGAGAAVYDATGCHSATIAGNEPAPRPSEEPLTPLLAYEIAASRRCLTTTPDTMTTEIDEDGFRRRPRRRGGRIYVMRPPRINSVVLPLDFLESVAVQTGILSVM